MPNRKKKTTKIFSAQERTFADADKEADLEAHQALRVEKVIYHPNEHYDIALLHLYPSDGTGQCAQFTNTIQPACIRKLNDVKIDTSLKCFVSGWGDTIPDTEKLDLPDVLQVLDVNLMGFTVNIINNSSKVRKRVKFYQIFPYSTDSHMESHMTFYF